VLCANIGDMAEADRDQRDWWEWHLDYDVPGSRLQLRTEIVHRHIRTFLDGREPGATVRIVSPCTGQGRELLPVIAAHPRRADVRARLVELDPHNVAAACDAVSELRLDWNVDIACGDPSVTDAWVGAVPADLVVLCGVLGWIDNDDAQKTIGALPQLCGPRAMVVWTLQPLPLERMSEIRGSFEEAGFQEQAFESPGLDASWVGLHRYAGAPQPLRRGIRLFTFPSRFERARAWP
jgi:hypothetical protein